MIKGNYRTKHKFIITLSTIFVFNFLIYSQANAIVAPATGIWGGAVTTIALGDAITMIALFLCIPIALGGFILRLLGFQKEGSGSGWQWHFKQAMVKLFKYFIYHFLLFSGLILIAKMLQSSGGNGYNDYIHNTSNPLDLLLRYVTGDLSNKINEYDGYGYNIFNTSSPFILLLLYATSNIINWVKIILFPTIFAVLWTYIAYRVRKFFNPLTIRPSVGSYLRLISWNFFIIFFVVLLVSTLRFF